MIQRKLMLLGGLGHAACLGVVPVFINAGAALLPAILAGVASLASLLLRPADLWRACQARPWIAAGVFTCIAGIGAGLACWVRPAAAHALGRRSALPASGDAAVVPGTQRIDWAALAIEWLRQEKVAAGTGTAVAQRMPDRHDSGAVVFGGGPLRSGYAGGGSPLELEVQWEFPAAGTAAAQDLLGAMYLSSPAVVEDTVYGGACLIDPQGSYGTVFCLDAATGRPRWTTSVYTNAKGQERDFKAFFSSPAVSADGRYVVIGQGLHNDADCDLVCLDAKTGGLHWLLPTPSHIESSPAIEGDLVVAGAGAIEVGADHKVKGHPGLVIAARISTGEKIWEFPLEDPESSPVIRDDMVYIGSGFNGNAVVALRTQTDEQLQRQGLSRLAWRTPTPFPATGAVTLVDDQVIVGCGNGDYVFTDPHPNGAVIALDRKTGTICWQAPMHDAVLGRIAVSGSRAIVPVRNGEVVALDISSRSGPSELWRQRVHGQKAILAGPAFTAEYVYLVSQDGWLAVLDAQDGRIVERVSLNAPGKPGDLGLAVSSPTVAGGWLYVGSETGNFRCFRGRQVKP